MRRKTRFADVWRSRWLRGALTGALVLGLLAAAAVLSYPWWASGLVRSVLEERASRLGFGVEIDDVSVDYGRAEIRGLIVSRDDVQVRLDHVELEFSRDGWFSRRVDVQSVAVDGGNVSGAASTLRMWLEQQSGAGYDNPLVSVPTGSIRSSLVPEALMIRGLDIALSKTTESEASMRARLSFDGRPRDREGTIVLEQASATIGAARRVAAASLRAELSRGPDGGVAFPVRIDVEGAATSISPKVAVADVSGTIELADRQLSSLGVDISGSFAESDAARRGGGSKLWSLTGSAARDLSRGRIELEMESFALGRIPEVLARLPVVASEQATVGGRLAVDFADGKADFSGALAVAGLHVSHPMLASDVVRDVGFEIDVTASFDPQARHLTLQKAVLARNGVALTLEGEIVHTEAVETRRYQLRASMPKVPCQDVLDAIPSELVPSLEGFRLGGMFELDVATNISFADLDAATLGGSVNLRRCRIRGVPARVSATRLTTGFSHRVVMRDGTERIVRLYPGTPTYTPLDAISPNMVAAVLTTEDGGFWRHSGFLPSQFAEALRRNLKAGRIRLGASTITMQMVKNVLLSHERTLSRKLQEMFLTWYVEETLPKTRIMEIYLNVIEFGPGVYGVTHAAAHYFGKTPRQLNSLEAAFLALMLPSPVRRHEQYCRGELSRAFQTKLRRIHELMHSREHIDELEFFLWKDATLHFDQRDRVSQAACLREIDRLLEGTHGQRAVSGLLEGAGVPQDDGPPDWVDDADLVLDDVDLVLDEDPSASDAPGEPAMDG